MKIINSNEALFLFGGYNNKQILPYLAIKKNAHVALEQPMYTIMSDCLVLHHCPYFFENKIDVTITINDDTYRIMITNFFEVALHGINVNVV